MRRLSVALIAALMSILILVTLGLTVTRRPVAAFVGEPGQSDRIWAYAIDAREPCWLRVDRGKRPVIRVNCFAIDGVLYTHSSRFAPIYSLLGGSWTQTVADSPELEVMIDGRIYLLRASRVVNESRRRQILTDRAYSYVPDGIQVYALKPR